MSTAISPTEQQRLAAFNRYSIPEMSREPAFDEIVRTAAQLLEAPIAAIQFVSGRCQWLVAGIGLEMMEVAELPVLPAETFQQGLLVVPDTLHDQRFERCSTTGGQPQLRFYAAVPLVAPDGYPIGALCIADNAPRLQGLTIQQQIILKAMAQQVLSQLELKRVINEQRVMLEEKTLVETELRAQRDHSRRLLENMDEGFLLLDKEFRVRQINTGGMRLETRPVTDIIGRTLWEAWPGTENLPMADAYRDALRDQIPVSLEEFYTFPDGRSLWLEIRAYPVEQGLAVFYRDITHKKEAEQALRAAEIKIRSNHDYLRLLLDCIAEGFYSVDREGVTIICNAAALKMLGFEREEEAIGKKLHEIIHHSHGDGSHYAQQDCPIYRAAKSGEPAYIETEFFFRTDGSSFPVEYRVSPIWRDGELQGAVCTFVDLTERKQTEERLQDTARRLQFTLRSAAIGEWDLDLVNDTSYRSPRHDQCFGYTEPIKDWGFDKFIQHVHPEDRDWVEEQFRISVAELKDWHFECRIVWPDHSLHWIAAHGSIYHMNGQPTKMSGIVFDITERKQAEQALRHSEQRALEAARQAEVERARLDAVLEAAPVGIFVADATGRLLRINSANRQLWGEELPAKGSIDGYHEWKGWWADGSARHGKRLEHHEWPLARVLRGEKPSQDVIDIESFHVPPVRRTIVASAAAIRNSQGEITGGVLAVQDITDQVKTEKALRKSEVHLSALFEQSGAGICETDLTGRIIRINERYCQIVGREPADALGRQMQEFTHPDDLPANLLLFRKAAENGEAFEIEKRYLRPDGSPVWVNNTVSLIHAGDSDPVDSILAVVIDISERKRAEEALRQADRRKDEFLAMLAHELRNPLAPIMAAAELLALASTDREKVRKTSTVINRQARHMAALVDDLLDVSRLTRGLVTLDKDDLDIKRIISAAVEQASPLIEAKRHHLAIELAAEPAHVSGDQKRLVQVVSNLLNNAAKYTPEGGRIRLRMEATEGEIILQVADNGIGIEQDLQPYVFELFAQAKRTSDRSEGGLGLGLALVRSLVELHGGKVSCFSAGPDKGSEFTIALPRLMRQNRDEEKAADPNVRPALNTLRILVVDDNIDAADMLAMLLQAAGHEVLVEHSSAQALETAQRELPDVCLLDIGLPGIDGNELAHRLKSAPETAGIELIAVTGYGQERDRETALAAGFSHHLVKPVDNMLLTALLNSISRTAAVRPAEQRLSCI